MTKIDKLLAVRKIPLSQGKYAFVDKEDYNWLNQRVWSATKCRKTFYAGRTETKPKRKRIYMHRDIMKAPPNKQVDHINLNGLDNRKRNLRLCTNSQNHQNSRKRGGKSCYKGVSKCTYCNKWQAYIKHNGKTIWLGNYDIEIEAARAYNKKAKRLFGEFARLNNV